MCSEVVENIPAVGSLRIRSARGQRVRSAVGHRVQSSKGRRIHSAAGEREADHLGENVKDKLNTDSVMLILSLFIFIRCYCLFSKYSVVHNINQ